MVRRLFTCLCVIALITVSPARSDEPKEKPWKAGTARVIITPDKPMWMSGYAGRDKPAQGKLHDLWAKALAVEDPQGHRVVLVTMDLVGIDRELAHAVWRELYLDHGLARSALMLSVSHTHTGPVVGGNLAAMYSLDPEQQKLVNDYAAALQGKLVHVGSEAIKALKPARIEWGNGHATFAVNRRTNKETDVPRLREAGQLKGPVDHDVPVLSVRDLDGKIRAVVFGYACHSTVLPFFEWSGDYPGFAQIELEKAYPGATALFWAGCGGDQNPLPRRAVSFAERYGKELADRVQDLLRAPMKPVRGGLRTRLEWIALPYDKLPSREQVVNDSLSSDRYVAARAKGLLAKMRQKGRLRGYYPYPVQAWRLGDDLLWVALGGEVVVDYSVRLKRELGPGRSWVTAYANDVMAYIPSLRVLKEGGYEGGGAMLYYGLPTVWGPRVEELIVEAAHRQVQSLRERQDAPWGD